MPSWKPNCLKGVDQNDHFIEAIRQHNNNLLISSPTPIILPSTSSATATPSPQISNKKLQGIFFLVFSLIFH